MRGIDSKNFETFFLSGKKLYPTIYIVLLLNNQNSDNVCTMAIKPKINHDFKSCVVF